MAILRVAGAADDRVLNDVDRRRIASDPDEVDTLLPAKCILRTAN